MGMRRMGGMKRPMPAKDPCCTANRPKVAPVRGKMPMSHPATPKDMNQHAPDRNATPVGNDGD